jgi:PiT family inorganic phosphate transporter
VASRFGLPVSTTHVSVGALSGIGVANRRVRWNTLTGILLSWVVTFPVAAVASGAIYLVVTRIV